MAAEDYEAADALKRRLEALQAMVERRPGGEAGIVAVQCVEGDAIWAAAQEGRWSRELAVGSPTGERARHLTT